jgi:predicted RNase H-like HicB family nuclease
MIHYPALIVRDRQDRLTISFPDLPNCTAVADVWGDVPRAAVEALLLWFEGKPDIEPTAIDVLRERSDLRQELAMGAVLLLIPLRSVD